MKMRLKHIMDLDYFIRMDEVLDSREDIRSQTRRDRDIYHQCKGGPKGEKALLMSWLAFRKKEFFKEKDPQGFFLLPGRIFSLLYSWMIYAMVLSGVVTGISLAYSFLVYHGNRPINVMVFIALFVLLPFLLLLFTLIWGLVRGIGINKGKSRFRNSILHTLMSSLFFNVLPKILKKVSYSMFKKNLDTLEYTASLIHMKNRDYKVLFFWPFFILTSVFAFSFSAGALGGTFFRVIISDMAFGWQSTLMTTSDRVHDIVSFIALPWSWLVPESLALPSLEQIQGSRIILKDGISVLATHDLISWWPFICMGILFYAVIPRGLLIVTGILAQYYALGRFNFNRPRFTQVIVRMQSFVLDIDGEKIPKKRKIEKNTVRDMEKMPSLAANVDMQGQRVLLIASKRVYSPKKITKIIHCMETYLFFNVTQTLGVCFNFNDDGQSIGDMSKTDVDQVILVQEVWQPPIRGLLHYITQIKAAMPEDKPLWILLTQDAGQADLRVDKSDINYDIWEKAVFKLKNPDIVVKRFVWS
jgi:Protein of unknown function (DUF2868)